ncbi:MAG: chemotaxis protein CheD [Bacteroidales bacterium]|nr:chemotaxis protein CheD [Bacteroidales bacterium]MDD4672319.1 chemotaxis protein CheD [Bacteroidales bacterium]
MNQIATHFLFPSTIFVNREPHRVSTILGSCVAVCVYDPVLKFGGINHFMLPFWNGQGLASPKYGNIAIERLVDKMISLGSKKSNIKAKVFGGGEVIETSISQFNIGHRNIKLALEILDELNIPVVAKSLGGKRGRKIEYCTGTGEVKQRYIEKIVTAQTK